MNLCCRKCGRKLAEITAGSATVEVKCPRCKTVNASTLEDRASGEGGKR